MAPRDIEPGEEWPTAIIRAINASKALVLVLTTHSNASPQVRNEVERAVNAGARVIPFRAENVEPSEGLIYFLGSRHWFDAHTGPLEPHVERLARTIKSAWDAEPGAERVPVTDREPPARAATKRWTRWARYAWLAPALTVFANLMSRFVALAPDSVPQTGSANLLNPSPFFDVGLYLIGTYGLYQGRLWGAWGVLIALGIASIDLLRAQEAGTLIWALVIGGACLLVILFRRTGLEWVRFPSSPVIVQRTLWGTAAVALLQLFTILGSDRNQNHTPMPVSTSRPIPSGDAATVASAYQLLIADRLDEAEARATSVPRASPASGIAKAVLANVELMRYVTGRDSAAAGRSAVDLASAEQESPGDVLTLVARGTFELAVGRDTLAARRHLGLAVAADSTNAFAHHQLGVVLIVLRQYELATRELRRAVAIAPEMAWAYGTLSFSLLGQRACGEAAEIVTRIVGRPQVRVRNLIGSCFLESRQYPEAVAQFEQASAVAPEEAELRGNLAGALFMAGRRDQAGTEAQRARAQGLTRHWVFDSLHLR